MHEASHTSMDAYHAAEPGWFEAAAADGVALSTYARDNPNREDVAETVGPFLAARLRADRVDAQTVQQIEAAVPNRLRYLARGTEHCTAASQAEWRMGKSASSARSDGTQVTSAIISQGRPAAGGGGLRECVIEDKNFIAPRADKGGASLTRCGMIRPSSRRSHSENSMV